MNQALQGNYRGKMNPETLVKIRLHGLCLALTSGVEFIAFAEMTNKSVLL